MAQENLRYWISHIEIAGLAGSRKEIKCDLNPDLNIFFGDNGSGKTSLLKILNSAAGNDASPLSDIPFERAMVKMMFGPNYLLERSFENEAFSKSDETLPRAKSLLSPAAAILAGATSEAKEPSSWNSILKLKARPEADFVPVDGDDAQYILPHQYLPTYRLYVGLESGTTWTKQEVTDKDLEENFAKLIQGIWKDYNYSTSTAIGQARAKGMADVLKDVWSKWESSESSKGVDLKKAYDRVKMFLEGQKLADILVSYEDFKRRYDNEGLLRKVIRDINDVEETIERTMAPKAKLKELVTTLFGERLRLVFEEQRIAAMSGKEAEIGLGTLSSGQKHLLMILVRTLQAYNNCIIIDEPELSMHVSWQSRLISDMSQLSPASQIILATHSPEISATVPDEKLFRL